MSDKANKIIKKKDLLRMTKKKLLLLGFSKQEVLATIRSWMFASDSGKLSHGFDRLEWLIDNVSSGKIIPSGEVNLNKRGFVFNIKGNKTLGYSVAESATKLIIKSAKKNGIGIATFSDCYPTGCMGQYTEEIVKNGLVGFVISSSPPKVSIHGGVSSVLGTMGHSFGFPSEDIPYIYDSSIGAITNGELQKIMKDEMSLPNKTVFNKNGEYAKDGKELVDNLGKFNGVISIAGDRYSHRFSGLGVSLELFCKLALISENSTSTKTGYSFFMALNPSSFGDENYFRELVYEMQQKVKDSTRLRKDDEIFFAGEKSYKLRQKNVKSDSMLISERIYNLLKNIA